MMIVVGWLAVIIEYTVCIYSLVYDENRSAATEYTVGVYSLVCGDDDVSPHRVYSWRIQFGLCMMKKLTVTEYTVSAYSLVCE